MSILVPIADGPQMATVLDVAVEMGRQYDRDLSIVHIVADEAADGDAHRIRDDIETHLADDSVDYEVSIEMLSRRGARSGPTVAREILDLATGVDVDHIVMGHTEKSFVEGVTKGSAASSVVDDAGVPVTIVPAGTDYSPTARDPPGGRNS